MTTNCTPRRAQRHAPHRPGAILVVALVCLLVVMSIVAGMIKGAIRERRQLHQYRDLRQTDLLVEAGADRAAARLAEDPEYRGETWRVPAEEIGHAAGEVTIEVSRDESGAPTAADGAPSLRVRVSAEYPLVGVTSIRRTRTFAIAPQSIPEEE
jgi:hypothetical protein